MEKKNLIRFTPTEIGEIQAELLAILKLPVEGFVIRNIVVNRKHVDKYPLLEVLSEFELPKDNAAYEFAVNRRMYDCHAFDVPRRNIRLCYTSQDVDTKFGVIYCQFYKAAGENDEVTEGYLFLDIYKGQQQLAQIMLIQPDLIF